MTVRPRLGTSAHLAASRWLVLLCLGLAAACGDPEPVQGDPTGADTGPVEDVADVQIADEVSGQPDVAEHDAAPDGGLDVFVPDTEDDTSACPGGAGCPCSSVGECDSGFCIDTPDGQQCAGFCTTDCPDGFKCSTVSGSGGDEVNICVPKHGRLCDPCNENAACQGPGNGGARCVDGGAAGAFCGVSCQTGDQCPTGYSCELVTDVAGQESKQCVVEGGGACTCSESARKLELWTKCTVGAGDATCEGKRTCLQDGAPGAPAGGGLTSCVAPEPADETCDGKDNDCDGQTDEATCDDNNPCTDDSCGGAAGCSHLNNTSPCDADGSLCTKDDVCVNGKCTAGKPLVCADDNPCTNDVCDPPTGCTFTDADGIGCNADDSDCTVADSCKGGKCAPGPKKACISDDQCVEGKCSVLTGACTYLVKDGVPCNDGNPCTTGELCKGEQCTGQATGCDDGNPCTGDSCDPKVGCLHTPVSSPCDDGNACTEGDTCTGGKCQGPAAKTCEDGNPCTTDSCDVALGCLHKPSTGNPCDDGNQCTTSDACENGSCVSGSNTCGCNSDDDCKGKEDGNLCNGTLFCDKAKVPFQCQIKPLSVIKCDESVNGACQTNVCDPSTGACKLIKKPDGLPCDADGDLCTAGDACSDGLCALGQLQVCDDKNACTDDVCDSKAGCKYVPNTSPCDADGNACTVNDVCTSGTCVAGKAKACNDDEGCTKDECDPATADCKFVPQTKSCSDNDVCTSGDACGTHAQSGKYTCIPGKASSCDDGNPCTVDSCDPVKGCSSQVDPKQQVACYTGDPKTKGKGQCKDGLQQCGADGKLGPCQGEVLPAQDDPCDGVDNDCDGITDKGCAPESFTARFATVRASGTGPSYAVGAVVGASQAAGKTSGGKYQMDLGFLTWLEAFLAK